MPLHPQTEARLRSSGQFERARTAYVKAHQRGVDAPTPYPINLRSHGPTERTDLNVLTILVDFSDHPADTTEYPRDHYQELLYSVGSFPTGSLRDYYLENSCGEVNIVGEVAGWYRMPHSYSYYVDSNYGFGGYPQNAQKLTEDAVAAADADVDFSLYDNDNDGYVDALFVVHAGPGAEQTGSTSDIWSHAWVTHNVPLLDGVQVYSYSQEPEGGKIGVFGHELGHALFGLPDLYDYNYDSQGTGYWSMMSAGCWGGGGATPVHFDAWCKTKMGFAEAINVESDQENVAIPQVQSDGVIYRLWTHGELGSQYFLVENRQQVGFDVSLPGSGLLIYHVEEQYGSNSNQWYPNYTSSGHYLVAVEQADGEWDLEQNHNSGDGGDPWPGSSGTATFDAFSIPDSRDYDFATTSVVVENISASASTIYADLEVGLVVPTGVTVSLNPASSPIILPGTGGSFNYEAEVTNHAEMPAEVQFWVMAILPNGSSFGPLFGPYDLFLLGSASANGNFTQNVPGRAPYGQYNLVGYVGSYPYAIDDSSYFSFSKDGENDTGQNLTDCTGRKALTSWRSTGGFEQRSLASPAVFELSGAFPNPFNPTTTITYALPRAEKVVLKVYDVSGRYITTLVEGWREAGRHEASFDAADLSSGVYFYRLEAGLGTASGKMVLMK